MLKGRSLKQLGEGDLVEKKFGIPFVWKSLTGARQRENCRKATGLELTSVVGLEKGTRVQRQHFVGQSYVGEQRTWESLRWVEVA